MAITEWIKSAREKIRDAVEQALPRPPGLRPVPVRVPVNPPRPTRHSY